MSRQILVFRFSLRALTIGGLLAALLTSPAGAEERTIYQKIQLPWPSVAEWELLRGLPGLELMALEEGQYVRFLSRPELTRRLVEAGLAPTVVVEDLGALYSARAPRDDFGDFYNYAEATAFLDSIHTARPDITTAKFSLGTTWEGRDIWAIKISDNPMIDEDEPEVLLDALHHAREPATASVVLGFLSHLCDNYGTDPEASFIVDNRELWIVPVVNPDGYVYNETYPYRMWRKNRRDNPGTCEGVDLNRNYSYEWGGPGSYDDPCDDLYRGPEPFSEPETQALRDLIVSRHFVTHDSYHAVVPAILFPWGYTYDECADHDTFMEIGAERARDSGYPYYPGAVLYPASGVMFDWAYGDTVLKPKMYSFTTELGGDDFWPAEELIPGIVAGNIYSNIYLSLIAGAYVRAAQVEVAGGDGNGRLDPGEAADLVVTLENPGVLHDAPGVTLTLTSDNAYVGLLDAVSSYGTLAAGGSADNAADPFRVTVDPATPDGHKVEFQLTITWGADAVNRESAGLTVGILPAVVSDDFESGNQGWSQDPSHTASTGDWVIIDPNPTDYQPGEDTTPDPGVMAWITAQNTAVGTDDVDDGISAVRSPVWDLSSYDHVTLMVNYFHGQRDPGDDPGGDFFRLDLSNDGGNTYPANIVDIGDVHHVATWRSLEVKLEDLLALTNQMRIRVQAADGSGPGDIVEAGIDDLLLLDGGTGNEPPGAPLLAAPGDGAVVATTTPLLRVVNVLDPEGDPLTYGFRVYADSLLTGVVASVDGVTQGPFWTSWTVDPPLSNGTYWWRAYAADPEERGLFMTKASFTVEVPTDVPGPPSTSAFALHPAKPNPFVGATSVHFTLPRGGRVRADVFDSQGRWVRSLFRGVMPAGPQVLTWNGRDERGDAAAAGVYFMLLRTEDRERALKLTLIR